MERVLERFLIPIKGVIVRDPITRAPLPEGGALKPFTGKLGRYWRRRVNDGTCIIKETKAKVSKPSKPEEVKNDNRI